MRKGMSPLIASVLLIAVTVGVSAILINWMTSYTKSQTSDISTQSTSDCTYKNIDFTETPSYDSDAENVTLYLENSGSKVVNVTDEYIKFVGDSTIYHCTKEINLDVGEPAVVNINNVTDCGGNLNPSGTTIDEVKLVYREPCQGFYSKWTRD